MKVECPHCEQRLDCDRSMAGRVIRCPACNGGLELPDRDDFPETDYSTPDERPSYSQPTEGVDATNENSTIAQFLTQRNLSAGLDLKGDDGGVAGEAEGQRYRIGEAFAQGGMGAILESKDLNLRRSVAMKVMLSPDDATDEDLISFVEEAQVTSQLEHPGIVPVHELGVDGQGHVFYTMKYVTGVTLQSVIEGLRDGDRRVIRDYPLGRLLTIFQQVSDAVAFAHSRSVVHRDLKPENIMVGEYGEVMLLDWGLAKVLSRDGSWEMSIDESGDLSRRLGAGGQSGSGAIVTMVGDVMGTPGFMAPEQASGMLSDIDERTDIYALGAILYTILSLRPPIEGRDLDAMLDAAIAGDFPAPATHNRSMGIGRLVPGRPQASRRAGFPHCPGGMLPESLSAVSMKALEVSREDRYQSVKELQTDVAAYQNGFATTAEDAGAWRQWQLFVRRNRTVSIGVLVMLIMACGFMVKVVGSERRARRMLADVHAVEAARRVERKGAAPAIYQSAVLMLQVGDFDSALTMVETACDYDPSLGDARLVLCALRARQKKWSQALAEIDLYVSTHPSDEQGKRIRDIFATAVVRKGKGVTLEGLAVLFADKGMPRLASEFASSFQAQQLIYRSTLAQTLGKEAAKGLEVTPDGRLGLRLHGLKGVVSDLSVLRGMPLEYLSIQQAAKVTDLRPLEGMKLRQLIMADSRVRDLSPLAGMPLEHLDISGSQVFTLEHLRGLPLTNLNVRGCVRISDFSALAASPVATLDAGKTSLSSLERVADLPLTWLDVSSTKVEDLEPLVGSKLEHLSIANTKITDFGALRRLPLKRLDASGTRSSDFGPLSSLPLEELYLSRADVFGLAALRSLRLRVLDLSRSSVVDISALADMPLETLNLDFSKVTDLSALTQCPLVSLRVSATPIDGLPSFASRAWKLVDVSGTSLTSLRALNEVPSIQSLSLVDCSEIKHLNGLHGVSITTLYVSGSGILDLRALEKVHVRELIVSPTTAYQGLNSLLVHPTLQRVAYRAGKKAGLTPKAFVSGHPAVMRRARSRAR